MASPGNPACDLSAFGGGVRPPFGRNAGEGVRKAGPRRMLTALQFVILLKFTKLKKMKNTPSALSFQVRSRSIEAGGRIAQDLGLGRIVGQILVYLYLTDGDCSLDEIGMELGLSKAAVSVAARRLENLGLLKRVWKSGDRKSYYRTADNLSAALQEGMRNFLNQKLHILEADFGEMNELLDRELKVRGSDGELRFLQGRIRRIRQLQSRLSTLLKNPIVRLLAGS